MIDLKNKKESEILELIRERFKSGGTFNLGEFFGYMPQDLDQYRAVITSLKAVGARFAEDEYGIDILNTKFAATLTELPQQEKQELTPEEIIKAIKLDLLNSPVAYLGKYVAPALHDPSDLLHEADTKTRQVLIAIRQAGLFVDYNLKDGTRHYFVYPNPNFKVTDGLTNGTMYSPASVIEEPKVEIQEPVKQGQADTHHGMVVEDIKQKVKQALARKPLYQLSALVGDLEYDPSNPDLIKNPIAKTVIDDLKSEGFTVSYQLTGAGKKSYSIGIKKEKPDLLIDIPAPNELTAVLEQAPNLHSEKTIDQIVEEKKQKKLEEVKLQEVSVIAPELEQKKTKAVKSKQKVEEFKQENKEEFERLKVEQEQERTKVIESFVDTHKYLDQIDATLQAEWSENPKEMTRYLSQISTLYAHLQSLKVDSETAYKKRAYDFYKSKEDGLKQYEYKDALSYHCLDEEKLTARIEGQLKTISKHCEVLITLISLVKTEMSLGLKNPGQQA